jgi:hypothetical protein
MLAAHARIQFLGSHIRDCEDSLDGEGESHLYLFLFVSQGRSHSRLPNFKAVFGTNVEKSTSVFRTSDNQRWNDGEGTMNSGGYSG